jgi:hypothetical protein
MCNDLSASLSIRKGRSQAVLQGLAVARVRVPDAGGKYTQLFFGVGYRRTMCIAFPMQTFLMPSVTIHFPEA